MIAWTDIENTGLRTPREEHLLEVAVVITDDDLNEKAAISVVCKPVGIEIDALIPTLNPYVVEMYTKNGLFDDVRKMGMRRHEAETLLVDFILTSFADVPPVVTHNCANCGKWEKDHVGDDKVCPQVGEAAAVGASVEVTSFLAINEPAHKYTPLAGSTVGFDKAHLQEHMPNLVKLFHYRVIDVSSLGELAARWSPEMYKLRPKNGDAHRALPDIRGSIALLRYWRDIGFIAQRGFAVDLEGAVARLKSLGIQVVRP